MCLSFDTAPFYFYSRQLFVNITNTKQEKTPELLYRFSTQRYRFAG